MHAFYNFGHICKLLFYVCALHNGLVFTENIQLYGRLTHCGFNADFRVTRLGEFSPVRQLFTLGSIF
jgi:hypothetical protein